MNVFVDFHHSSLLESLILLFEKRLKGKVFRPLGMEWFTEGYWKINDQLDTAKQFLSFGSIPSDGTPPLNENSEHTLSYSDFFKTDIDIVIASIPQHLEPFKRLCDLHPNKPKLIYQIGNQWDIMNTTLTKNVMSSAHHHPKYPPEGVNYVEYHQEFDLHYFSPDKLTLTDEIDGERVLTYPEKSINSFINVFDRMSDYPLFLDIENRMSRNGWTFKSYGGQCRDGNMQGVRNLSSKMRESRFIWHTKAGGDGYGHILHNAAAVGKPVIIRRSDYSGKLGENLLINGETCIEIDNLNPEQIVEKILYFSEPEDYMDMMRNVYWNFQRVVDFDREEQLIKQFINRLI